MYSKWWKTPTELCIAKSKAEQSLSLHQRLYAANRLCCAIFFTHWGQVTHICVSKSTSIGSDNGLSTLSEPICWNIVNWTLRNKLQWNINQNSYIFIKEKAFGDAVRKLVAILSRPQCVKHTKIGSHSSWVNIHSVLLRSSEAWKWSSLLNDHCNTAHAEPSCWKYNDK